MVLVQSYYDVGRAALVKVKVGSERSDCSPGLCSTHFFRTDSTLTHMTVQVTQLRLNSNPKFANLTQLRLNSKPKFTNLTQL